MLTAEELKQKIETNERTTNLFERLVIRSYISSKMREAILGNLRVMTFNFETSAQLDYAEKLLESKNFFCLRNKRTLWLDVYWDEDVYKREVDNRRHEW